MNLALNHAIINLDNLSDIDGETSDRLCRLSTAPGLSKRQLYTGSGEQASSARPWVTAGRQRDLPHTPRRRPAPPGCVRGCPGPPKPLGSLASAMLPAFALWARPSADSRGSAEFLAAETALVLRDQPPKATTDTMAEHTRIGRALSTVVSGVDRAIRFAVGPGIYPCRLPPRRRTSHVTVFDLFFRDRPYPTRASRPSPSRSGLPRPSPALSEGDEFDRRAATGEGESDAQETRSSHR